MRKLFSIIHQLAAVRRFSRDYCAEPETVLTHMGFCGFFAFVLAERLIKAGVQVDLGKLYRRVMMHDIDEAALGDIPRTTKYWNSTIRHAFAEAEHEAVGELCEELGLPNLIEWWATAKSEDIEGYIMKMTDIAAVVYKVWSEVSLLNNLSFCRVARELRQFLDQIALELSAKMPPEAFEVVQSEFARFYEILNFACCQEHPMDGLAL